MVRPKHVIKLKSHSSVAGDEAFRGGAAAIRQKAIKG